MANPYIKLLVIYAEDISVTERFYATLGLEFVSERHGRGPEHRAAQSGAVVFEIYPASEHSPATHSLRLGFEVANLEQQIEALLAAGGQIVKLPERSAFGQRAVVRDPEGRKVELTEICNSSRRCG